MNCPKCWIDGMLLLEHHEGVTVMECYDCGGFWLDRNEIDDIVDVKFTQKELESMVEVTDENTDITCLHCGSLLKKVNYTPEKMVMGTCPEGHGWYWDNPKKVVRKKYMESREKALQKQFKRKKSLKEFLRGIKSWEFIELITKKYKGTGVYSPAIEKAVKRLEKEMKEMEERRMEAVRKAQAEEKAKKAGKSKSKKKVSEKKEPAGKRGRPKKKS